ncbi:MAG TPA: outer membrane beta-barrel protein [Candidatus Acidoferrum sp.]|nr:outer membrane beta-barrel protein [Candidatus Acidoferrum sp.]
MRYRLPLLFMFMLCFVAISPAFGQWRDVTKWEVSPFVGFETGGSYPVTNSFTIDRLRVDSGLSYGTFIDCSLTENSQAEFMWSRNNTRFSERDAATHAYSKAFNSDFDQFSFGFLYMLKNSERKLRPFIAGGIGFSHEFNDGANPNRTLLAFNLGGGAKYEVSRHFALRGDLRWLPSRANKTPAVQCDFFGNCFQQNVSNYLQRVNFTGGIAFRF